MKRKKARAITLRFRKGDPIHNLYAACTHYIRVNGGDAIVVGGIEVQEWPEEPESNFRIAIRVTGTKPQFNKKGNQ